MLELQLLAVLDCPTPPNSTAESEAPEADDFTSRIEGLAYVSSTEFAEVVTDMRAKNR